MCVCPTKPRPTLCGLLDASRAVVNQALTILWPHLDEFGTDRVGPAWKQVGKYIGSPSPTGDRQWRCESEVVGRVLRQQAERKKAFELVVPILSDGFIRPKTEKRPAGKNRPAIKEAITALQKSLEEDETSFVALQNVVEQACNYFFQQDRFPATYEELQPVPLLKVGMLTYAGDDGRRKRPGISSGSGSGCRSGAVSVPLSRRGGSLALAQSGHDHSFARDALVSVFTHGELMAPTLREEHRADGERFAVLDFIIEVEKAELPAWESVERVLRSRLGRAYASDRNRCG